MCGIVGFNWSDRNLLQAMMDKVRHRGPDESGFYIDKGISLGHQRLKIIDLHSDYIQWRDL
jgi:asparagine synthase (glutamine-hydrolysing)